MTFSYNIEACQRALLRQNLDQKDLAEEGLSESVISKFFRGLPVRPKTAGRIIKKLGLDMDDVLVANADSSRSSSRRKAS